MTGILDDVAEQSAQEVTESLERLKSRHPEKTEFTMEQVMDEMEKNNG